MLHGSTSRPKYMVQLPRVQVKYLQYQEQQDGLFLFPTFRTVTTTETVNITRNVWVGVVTICVTKPNPNPRCSWKIRKEETDCKTRFEQTR